MGMQGFDRKYHSYIEELENFRDFQRQAKPITEQIRSATKYLDSCEKAYRKKVLQQEQKLKEKHDVLEAHRFLVLEMDAELADLQLAIQEAATKLAKAKEDHGRVCCAASGPGHLHNAAPPNPPTPTHDGHAFAAPITVTVEAADHVQAVLNDMRGSGKIPVHVVQAFEFAINRCFLKPPGAQPPALGGQAMPAGGNEGEAEAAAAAARAAEAAAAAASAAEAAAAVAKATADARPTATVGAGKGNGKGAADPY